MGASGPVDVDDLKWHVTVGMNFPAHWLDDPETLRRGGIDPAKNLRLTRAAHDELAAGRGLIFIGEVRLGDQIQRQYIVPTFWWRLRFLVLKPRLEKPRRDPPAPWPGDLL